jgi:hypothetical protein
MIEEDYLRIAVNPFEFLKLCKLNDAHGGVIDFLFWPHIVELVKVFLKFDKVIVLKSRQLGVSYILALYALWKAMTVEGFNCLIISAGQEPASRLLEKCKFAYLNLPDWLRNSVPYGKWSETEITFPTLGSRIVSFPSTERPALGETASLVIMDEWDFHAYPEKDYASAEPTISAGGQIIGVSTSDKTKPASLFKNLYIQAAAGKNGFKAVFLPWSARPGRGDNWFEVERKAYIGREDEFEENYPITAEQALSPASARSFFDVQILKAMPVRDPSESKYGCVDYFTRFQPGFAYAAGADISQGVSGDYQTFVVLGKRGLSIEDVAYIHVNDLKSKTFAFYMSEVGKEYNFPMIAGEANSMGLATLQELTELNYPNLFYRDENRTKLGWWTDQNSKERALIDLDEALVNGILTIRYKPAIDELMSFQRLQGRTGKVEFKGVGTHDDLVMALAIAYQVIKDQSAPTKSKFKSILTRRSTAGIR